MDYEKLNQFPVVPTTGIASLVTDELVDRSLYALVLELGGTTFTKAMITNVRIRLDGKDIINGISATQLEKISTYEGLTADTNYLYIPFGDNTARTIRGQYLGAMDLSVYRKPLEIEITIAGATAPTLQAWAYHDVPKSLLGIGFDAAEVAQMRALIRTVIQPAAAVSRKSYNLSLGGSPGARLRRAVYFHTNLTSLEYKKGSFVKWDDVSVAANANFQKQFARVPQSGVYVLDRVADGNQGSAETTVDPNGRPWNQQLNLTTSAGDTITAFADVYIPWPLL
ncbi:major capsid protein P2 [Zhongshania sp. BJYM1]|uniref:major capsid protein P2 n=1 Tax=Zhongshania aquatica TaxID=2965069 RepID=UPI0022B507B5|nr:major capsid protein P2 [Marortus sp. BJYM1]